MALVLTEEQNLLRDSARGFIADKAPVAHLRKLRDERDALGWSRALWRDFADMGFAGILIDEAQGGSALGPVEAGVVMEEIGANLTPSPFFATSLVGATALKAAGGAPAQELLRKVAAGEATLALAVDERAKHRPAAIETRATRVGNAWEITGAKTFVIDGNSADWLIVAARASEAPAGAGLFLVDAKAPGVEIERTILVDAHNAARITFDKAQASALGDIDKGEAALAAALNVGRAMAAAELVGLSQAAFDITVAYLKERSQFGQRIGEFQALQHRAAHLYCELEVTRATVLKALQALAQAPETAGPLVSLAKARASQSADLAVREGVQMHGGVGMTDAFDIGLYMKRARALIELFGDAGFHLDSFAKARGY